MIAHQEFRVAHASRVSISASRRNDLFKKSPRRRGRRRPRARRARYPEMKELRDILREFRNRRGEPLALATLVRRAAPVIAGLVHAC